jgi:hypothetical protein
MSGWKVVTIPVAPNFTSDWVAASSAKRYGTAKRQRA